MAKKSKDDAPEEKDAAAEKGGKKKGALLPAIVIAIALLGGGAMAGGMFGGSDEAAADTPEPTETPTLAELGLVTELESATLNLAGDGNHFLKLGVAIETGPEVTEALPTAPIYDAVIDLFSDYTYTDLSVPTTRDRTKDELLAALAEIYGDDVVRVYYTEFVMQ